MNKMSSADIDAAHARILKWIRVTPVIRMQGPGARPVVLKLEGLQRSGSFKLRGALNKLLVLGSKAQTGVITASGGNHGLGVSWAGWLLDVKVHVFVPGSTPSFKIDALERGNAIVRKVDGNYADAEREARRAADEHGLPYIHAYDDPDVIAGQGTVIREFLSQAPEIGTTVVAIGGGGLASGSSLAADGRRIVGVEPIGAATMHAAFEAGGPVHIGHINSIAADSLGAAMAGRYTYDICSRGIDRVELVSDSSLVKAQRWLWDHLRLVSELGAAAGLAALSNGVLDQDPGPIGIVVCGSNVHPKKFIN
ncbi:MAG: pyridoxal-phosphate dependent enzyme [Myxococcota bacterium]|nr:pyridoxal-phosphate dependent enzyme [Myxococcota bacterium]